MPSPFTHAARCWPLPGLALALSMTLAGCAGDPVAEMLKGGAGDPGVAAGTHSSHAPDGEVSRQRVASRSAKQQIAGNAKAWGAATKAVLPAAKATAKRHGLDALAAGDLTKAEAQLRRAVDAKAPDWHVHSALGVTLAASGRLHEARKELERALALAPEHPSVLNNLALAYALDGKPADAERLMRRAAAASDAKRARNNLALLLAAKGQPSEARAIVVAALPEARARRDLAYMETLGKGRTSNGEAGSMLFGQGPAARSAPTANARGSSTTLSDGM